MKKKAMALTVAAMMAAAMITGCGQTAATTAETAADTTVQTEESTADTESTAADTAAADGESYTIGISQFAEHGSLDNCRTGFLEGLKEAGIEEGVNLTVLFDNAQADTATASMISDNYVSQKVDLICAIATPSAMSAYNSCLDSDIPVIYTAVSDPVSAGLAKEDKTMLRWIRIFRLSILQLQTRKQQSLQMIKGTRLEKSQEPVINFRLKHS